MAITVTATQGGSTAAGMVLRVYVLTQAAATQNGATVANQFATTLTWTFSITTTQTGSRVYGTAGPGSSGMIVTPAALTTVPDAVNDGTNGETYVTFKATSLTGTPGATTLGFTVNSTSPGPFVMAEIKTAGSMAEDGSAPAVVSTTTLTALTTAAFTPPAGSLLVALTSTDGGVGVTTMALTDSADGATGWIELVKQNTSGQDYSGVWVKQVAGGATDATVAMGSALAVTTAAPASQLMSLTSTAYAVTAADLGGGTGSWSNTGNADGSPDGSVATWTVV